MAQGPQDAIERLRENLMTEIEFIQRAGIGSAVVGESRAARHRKALDALYGFASGNGMREMAAAIDELRYYVVQLEDSQMPFGVS